MNIRQFGSWGTFECRDGFSMKCWSVRPAETSDPLPAVLFVYEPFGINAEMQRVACDIADAGYVVMIPDIMQRSSFFSCIRRLMADMREEKGRGIDDLLDARVVLSARSDVISDRIAVMGLCMGGGFALILGKTGLFRVSAPFYGKAPKSIKGSCPIIASYGERDKITIKDAARLAETLNKSDIPTDFKLYPGSGHSFMTKPPNWLVGALGPILPGHARFDPTAAADATDRLVKFFRKYL